MLSFNQKYTHSVTHMRSLMLGTTHRQRKTSGVVTFPDEPNLLTGSLK